MSSQKKTQPKQSIKKSDDLKKEILRLEQELEREQTVSAELKDKLIHALADYQNLERNNQKRIEMMSLQLKRDIAKGLIEVADDIYFALDAVKKLELDANMRNWIQGMVQTLEKFQNILSIVGVVPISVNKGDSFDSSKHEAVATLPQGDVDTIHEVIQPGYMIGDYVIRPARVVVNKGKTKDTKK